MGIMGIKHLNIVSDVQRKNTKRLIHHSTTVFLNILIVSEFKDIAEFLDDLLIINSKMH